MADRLTDAGAGFAAFVQSDAHGTLKDLSADQVLALAAGASADPSYASRFVGAGEMTPAQVQALVIGEATAQKAAATADGIREERELVFSRMRYARRAAMFEREGLTPDDVARIDFDADNGDRSLLNLVKQRYIYS